MKTKKLIDDNNELRKQLQPQNQKFYEDFLTYVRMTSWNRNELSVEEQLLSILQDIIDAQNDGINADDYFGKNPQTLAREMITSLPISIKDLSLNIGLIIMITLACNLLPVLLSTNPMLFDLGTTLIVSCATIIAIAIIFKVMAYTIYAKLAFWKSWLVLTIIIMILLLMDTFIHTPFQIKITGNMDIAIISLIVIGILGYWVVAKPKKAIWFWLGYAIFICVLGIIKHLLTTSSMINNQFSNLIITLLPWIGLIIYSLKNKTD
jgi:hypothetical protein